MIIFPQETKDGLAEQLEKSSSIAFEIIPSVITDAKASDFNGVPTVDDVSQNIDLLYFNSILASVGWNLNDDVFDSKELWKARATPVNKKINFMHNEKDIVGHMSKAGVLDFSGRFVPDNLNEDSLPNNFDVVVGGYLYKYWQDEDLQQRMKDIAFKVVSGELAVSMECIFPSFDYAIITPDGENKVIARNESTAFLTKHLRIYGGEGQYEGFKVGRLLRNMVFTGNALVDRPANPRSLILRKDAKTFVGSTASINIFNKTESIIMPEVTKEQYDALLKRLETAEATAQNAVKKETDSLKEANAKLVADVTELTTAKKNLETELNSVKSEIVASKELAKAHEGKAGELAEKIKALETELAAAKEEMGKYKQEMSKNKRKASMAGLAIDESKVEDILNKLATASDEVFDEFVKAFPKKTDGEGNASLKDALNKAEVTTATVNVPSDTEKVLTAKASAWFAETLSGKSNTKGE